MSDLRFDPISGQWCLIAANRDDRPVELQPVEQVLKRSVCPFCAGNESETPTALALYDQDAVNFLPSQNGQQANHLPPWISRVIPNKFASFGTVGPESNGNGSVHSCSSHCDQGPFSTSALPGPQELVIPTPRHVASLGELKDLESRVLWKAAQDRIREMQAAGIAKHAMLFMNCRSQAGASLEHVHVQLMGSPMISDYLAGRVQRNRESLQRTNQTLVASILHWEEEQQTRIVKRTKHFTVLCPFASRFAYQMWIVPHCAETSFLELGEEERDELAGLCREMIIRLEGMLPDLPYNMLLQIAPFDDIQDDHWFVEILPRTTRSAGFELGTDVWVNPIAPEIAAERLR